MTSQELLLQGARELNIALAPAQAKAFITYSLELRKWNKKINLTSIDDEKEIIIRHFLDSLTYLKGFAPEKNHRLLDMGSGAGFPALPIKIVHPEISITLVESVKKKASFLRHVTRQLHLDSVLIIEQRLDEIANSLSQSFDIVTARAFADMKTALITGSAFLKPGGSIILSRGPEEIISGQELEKSAIVIKQKIDLTLPCSDLKRTIWVFKKRQDS
ncbi:MAG: 16S rRNA (guanine(527)-N(7))-methyltransferase RsmG [Nitrospirota bacterium]